MSTPLLVVLAIFVVCGTAIVCSGMYLAWKLEGSEATDYEKMARQLEKKAQKERLTGYPSLARELQRGADDMRERAHEEEQEEA